MVSAKVKFKNKSQIDNLSSRCCWCYEITLDRSWGRDALFLLDLPENTPIYDPKHYDSCNDYKIIKRNPNGSRQEREVPSGKVFVGRTVHKNTQTFEICFISKCNESENEIEISLHAENPDQTVPAIPIDGSCRVIGPSPIASSFHNDEIIDTLAYYEGKKMAFFLSEREYISTSRKQASDFLNEPNVTSFEELSSNTHEEENLKRKSKK